VANTLLVISYVLWKTGEVDILVGTQMVTKGLDFDSIGLVGIMSADNLLSFPDFRANERAFQLIEQVGGTHGTAYLKGEGGYPSDEAAPLHHTIGIKSRFFGECRLRNSVFAKNISTRLLFDSSQSP
jgi:hypothetical protein